jgi:hypothetical protein
MRNGRDRVKIQQEINELLHDAQQMQGTSTSNYYALSAPLARYCCVDNDAVLIYDVGFLMRERMLQRNGSANFDDDAPTRGTLHTTFSANGVF